MNQALIKQYYDSLGMANIKNKKINTVSFSRKMAKLTLFARGSNFPLEYSRASSENNRITSVSLGDTCSCKVMPVRRLNTSCITVF